MDFKDLPAVEGLLGPFDISTEAWREYHWPNTGVTYRLEGAIGLYRRDGGTTHRLVWPDGKTECVPCGALHPNTIIRWQDKDVSVPVKW
jgi:hypothetical protein